MKELVVDIIINNNNNVLLFYGMPVSSFLASNFHRGAIADR
jgi:hypothetical protein